VYGARRSGSKETATPRIIIHQHQRQQVKRILNIIILDRTGEAQVGDQGLGRRARA